MAQHLLDTARASRFRSPRALAAALLVAIGLIALIPAVMPMTGHFLETGQDALAAARKEPRARQAADSPLPFANRSARAICGNDLDAFRIDGVPMCTHGDDAPPPGYSRSVEVPPVARVSRAALALPCIDDGVSGPRVQVLYVYAGTSRYDEYLDSMRLWVAEMNGIFEASANQTGGHRQLRVVTDENCQADIIEIGISSAELARFDSSISAVVRELDALPDPSQHYTAERNYLMFADSDTYCGIGTVRSDDRPTADNMNNFGGGFSRADNRCWSGMVIAHEVMHNLGGVQLSAPNSSGGFHCVDERDVMCYSDTPYRPEMVNRCASGIWAVEDLFDCGNDDYFSTAAPECSYLGTHWNTSASKFLHDPTGLYQTTVRSPCLTLPSASGKVGSPLRVSATGFGAGETISVSVGGRQAGAGTASASGDALLAVRVPAMPGGARAVVVSGSSGSAQETFTVTPSVTVKPGAVRAGKRATIAVTGFGSGEQVTLRLGGKVVGRGTTDANGSVTIRVLLAADQRSGRFSLQATGGRGSRAAGPVTIVPPDTERNRPKK